MGGDPKDPKTGSELEPEPQDDVDREAILARRRRFVAIALAGAVTVPACGGKKEETPPQPCLSIEQRSDASMPRGDASTDARFGTDAAIDADAADADAGIPQPCLSPQPCLGVGIEDAGPDATPQPCLSLPAPDASDKG